MNILNRKNLKVHFALISAQCSRIVSMMLKQILDALVCPDPACRKPLKLADDETSLQCTGCGRVYPVQDGIPMLFVD
jgi:uncharacterized protein